MSSIINFENQGLSIDELEKKIEEVEHPETSLNLNGNKFQLTELPKFLQKRFPHLKELRIKNVLPLDPV